MPGHQCRPLSLPGCPRIFFENQMAGGIAKASFAALSVAIIWRVLFAPQGLEPITMAFTKVTMRAMSYDAKGPPTVLRLSEVALRNILRAGVDNRRGPLAFRQFSIPTKCRASDVLVHVHATSVNPVDVKMLAGCAWAS